MLPMKVFQTKQDQANMPVNTGKMMSVKMAEQGPQKIPLKGIKTLVKMVKISFIKALEINQRLAAI